MDRSAESVELSEAADNLRTEITNIPSPDLCALKGDNKTVYLGLLQACTADGSHLPKACFQSFMTTKTINISGNPGTEISLSADWISDNFFGKNNKSTKFLCKLKVSYPFVLQSSDAAELTSSFMRLTHNECRTSNEFKQTVPVVIVVDKSQDLHTVSFLDFELIKKSLPIKKTSVPAATKSASSQKPLFANILPMTLRVSPFTSNLPQGAQINDILAVEPVRPLSTPPVNAPQRQLPNQVNSRFGTPSGQQYVRPVKTLSTPPVNAPQRQLPNQVISRFGAPPGQPYFDIVQTVSTPPLYVSLPPQPQFFDQTYSHLGLYQPQLSNQANMYSHVGGPRPPSYMTKNYTPPPCNKQPVQQATNNQATCCNPQGSRQQSTSRSPVRATINQQPMQQPESPPCSPNQPETSAPDGP